MTKILVIEDAQDLRGDVMEMLVIEGFEVLGAENGLIGVEMTRQEHPDLVVCDIMMPELDGYQVLEKLRADPATASIPLIFLTAKTDRIYQRHGMSLGADDYITKPFLVSELIDSVRSQLRKRAELNEMADQRLNELRENIITALPHEFRTPLNTIIGFSDLLVAECNRIKPDQIADWGMNINEAAHRLYGLVENYLYYARIEVAANNPDQLLAMERAVCQHPKMVIEVQAFHRAQVMLREKDLTIDIDEVEGLAIQQDHLNKIIGEIVDNAFKFSQDDTPVRITTEVQPDAYDILVQDEGRGMSPERVETIGAYMQFDRWFHEQQGMGLGLAIVKKLLAIYRGNWWFNSEPDAGTTVRVRLKRAKAS